MKLVIIIFLVLTAECFCQSGNAEDKKTLARAGDLKITAEEFKERFDFSPHPRTSLSLDTALVKKEFLYTLIAEKLLAQKAKSLNLDTTEYIKGMMSYLQRLFIRDALYKKEISSKVKITPGEIAEGKKRISRVLVMKYLYSTGENEIKKLYSELKSGVPIESLIAGRPEAEEQKMPGTITYGTLDKNVEDAVYGLKKGQFTAPVFTGYRWYIFKLDSTLYKPFFNTAENQIKIRQVINKRQTEKLEDEYLSEFLGRFQISVDRALFIKLAGAIQNYVLAKSKNNGAGRNGEIYLTFADFKSIEDSLDKPALASVFIKFKNDPETAGQFLDQLKYNGLKIDSADIKNIAPAFSSYIKNYLESELLVSEGKKYGLENIPSVRGDMQLWENYYLSQQLMQIIQDSISISDAEAYEYYSKNNKIMFPPEKIDVQEIFTDSLETISKALVELDRKVPFDMVSAKYSIIDSLKTRGGYLGYLPESQKGTIGEIKNIARNMKIGEVYGPVKLDGGYALLKLVDVQNADSDKDTSFAATKDELKEVMKNIEFDKKIKSYVAGLALKYGVEIDTSVFKSVPVFQFNTVTLRMIGFGGKIYAFPYKPLFAGWYSLYLSKKPDVP